jgi:hypothetical protein
MPRHMQINRQLGAHLKISGDARRNRMVLAAMACVIAIGLAAGLWYTLWPDPGPGDASASAPPA